MVMTPVVDTPEVLLAGAEDVVEFSAAEVDDEMYEAVTVENGPATLTLPPGADGVAADGASAKVGAPRTNEIRDNSNSLDSMAAARREENRWKKDRGSLG